MEILKITVIETVPAGHGNNFRAGVAKKFSVPLFAKTRLPKQFDSGNVFIALRIRVIFLIFRGLPIGAGAEK